MKEEAERWRVIGRNLECRRRIEGGLCLEVNAWCNDVVRTAMLSRIDRHLNYMGLRVYFALPRTHVFERAMLCYFFAHEAEDGNE